MLSGHKILTLFSLVSVPYLNHNKFAIVCKLMIQYQAVQYGNTYIKVVSFKDTQAYGQKITLVSSNSNVESLLRFNLQDIDSVSR